VGFEKKILKTVKFPYHNTYLYINTIKPADKQAEEKSMFDRTDLTDRSGRRIGTIETQPNGSQIIMDRGGNRQGTYDPMTNTTTDRGGQVVGHGNLLSGLLDW
jgi:hypothetical protein